MGKRISKTNGREEKNIKIKTRKTETKSDPNVKILLNISLYAICMQWETNEISKERQTKKMPEQEIMKKSEKCTEMKIPNNLITPSLSQSIFSFKCICFVDTCACAMVKCWILFETKTRIARIQENAICEKSNDKNENEELRFDICFGTKRQMQQEHTYPTKRKEKTQFYFIHKIILYYSVRCHLNGMLLFNDTTISMSPEMLQRCNSTASHHMSFACVTTKRFYKEIPLHFNILAFTWHEWICCVSLCLLFSLWVSP